MPPLESQDRITYADIKKVYCESQAITLLMSNSQVRENTGL